MSSLLVTKLPQNALLYLNDGWEVDDLGVGSLRRTHHSLSNQVSTEQLRGQALSGDTFLCGSHAYMWKMLKLQQQEAGEGGPVRY